jgi:hypothetical protein
VKPDKTPSAEVEEHARQVFARLALRRRMPTSKSVRGRVKPAKREAGYNQMLPPGDRE